MMNCIRLHCITGYGVDGTTVVENDLVPRKVRESPRALAHFTGHEIDPIFQITSCKVHQRPGALAHFVRHYFEKGFDLVSREVLQNPESVKNPRAGSQNSC